MEEVQYKIVLYPQENDVNSKVKGAGSFKNTNGVGRVILKCDTFFDRHE